MRTRPQITRKLRNLLRRPRSPAREPSPRCHLRRTLIRRRPCRVDKKTHGETLGPESGQCLREYPRGAQHEVKLFVTEDLKPLQIIVARKKFSTKWR